MAGSHRGPKFQQRYEQARRFIVPMLERTGRPLHTMRALEIGCGEGPKVCALAPMFKEYVGIDLDAQGIAMGRANVAAYKLQNADLRLQEAADLARILADETFEVIVLYAVLEHLTVEERLSTLELCWEALPEDGILYIGEAPNRIAPIDYHSSRLPYFHLMPPQLAGKFLDRSPHHGWKSRVHSEDTTELGLYRNGQHVGFEEFDAAVMSYEHLSAHILADNWFEPMMNLYPLRWFEPRNLDDFAELARGGFWTKPAAAAFARYWIEFVLSKRPVDAPLPGIHFLQSEGKTPTRPDLVGTRLQTLSSEKPHWFTAPAKASSLSFGISKDSVGEVILASQGEPIALWYADDIRSANKGLWTLQSWAEQTLDLEAGQAVSFMAGAGSHIELCPSFIR